jgi:hypothetical protein
MPILWHLLNLHAWHLFLCLRSTVQSEFPRQTYMSFLRTVLLKNPLQPSHESTP